MFPVQMLRLWAMEVNENPMNNSNILEYRDEFARWNRTRNNQLLSEVRSRLLITFTFALFDLVLKMRRDDPLKALLPTHRGAICLHDFAQNA